MLWAGLARVSMEEWPTEIWKKGGVHAGVAIILCYVPGLVSQSQILCLSPAQGSDSGLFFPSHADSELLPEFSRAQQLRVVNRLPGSVPWRWGLATGCSGCQLTLLCSYNVAKDRQMTDQSLWVASQIRVPKCAQPTKTLTLSWVAHITNPLTANMGTWHDDFCLKRMPSMLSNRLQGHLPQEKYNVYLYFF